MLTTLLNPFAPKATPVDAVTALSMVTQQGAILLDVRDPIELADGGAARGALNVPLTALEQRADPRSPACDPELTRDRDIVLYCATGARSRAAGKVMRKLGYDNVYDLGALRLWRDAGGEIDA